MSHRRLTPEFPHRALRSAAAAMLLVLAACEGPEDRVAGRYVRTWREGTTPELGIDGESDHHVLVLHPNRRWSSEHSAQSIQQFDVPFDSGTWSLNGVTLTVAPTEIGPMQYTVSGDTLFPRTPERARQAERMTGYSMKIGADTYLLRER